MHYNVGDFDLLTYIKNPEVFNVSGGMVNVLQGAGLGIEINEELVRKNAEESKGYSWTNPVWRSPDGAVSEW